MVACGSKEPKPTKLAGRYINGTNNKVIITSPEAIDTIPLTDNRLFVHEVNLANPAMLKVRSGRIKQPFTLNLAIVVTLRLMTTMPMVLPLAEAIAN
ncbi:MAG TPA: hypothetical protein ENN49_00020 [Bacteroidales bacterium]|nr:hypothetical protein [Bacteroidales bacterium]